MADEIVHNDENIEPEIADTDEEFIPEDGEGNTATSKDAVKDLREKLKKAIAEKQEYLDGWQRAKADFVNARKRDEEDKKEFVKFAKIGLIEELIPVLESFEMARANKAAWEAVDKNWRMGIEYIQTQFVKVLQDNGVTEVDPKGQKFDPMLHEAVSYDEVQDESQDHVITDVIQKGYTIAGKIIKAPRVKVGEFKK
ncbi:MAG: nucleotide exchange factor GrpE [Patescibacteria group bacterium]